MKKTTKLVHLIILISIIFFGFSAPLTIHAQSPTDINQETIGDAELITYKTGLADSPTKELLFDGPNGIIVPDGIKSVDNIILFFHDTDNPDPEEMCEDLGLCAKINAIIAKNPIILVPQGDSSTNTKILDLSVIGEYLQEVVGILNIKGITVPNEFNLTLAGHGQGGTTTVFNVLKQNIEVSQTLIFDGCAFDRCTSIVQLNNTGTVSIYFSTTQTQAINAYQTKPEKTLLYRLTNSTQEIPKLCINEHLLTDLCENNAVVVDNDTLQQKEFTNIGNTPIGKMCESDFDCAMTGTATIGPGSPVPSKYKCDQRNETPKVCTCNTALQCAETYGGSANDWECNSGNIKSYYLNFCKNKLAPDAYSEVYPWRKPPAPAEEAPTKTPPKFTKPALLVLGAICNLSDVNFVPGQVSNIPWISECIVGIYKKMLILGVIFAILFIVVGGVQYIVSAGNTGNVSKAKETMTKSVLGLLLLICSYIVLYTVNPEITSLKSAEIKIVQENEMTPMETATGEMNTTGEKPEPAPTAPTSTVGCEPGQSKPSGIGDTSLFGQLDCYAKRQRDLSKVTHIIIHEGGYTAAGTLRLWLNKSKNGSLVSSHYMIERDGKIYQLLDEARVAYHTPSWHSTTIGIDLAINTPGHVSAQQCLTCLKTGSCKTFSGKPVKMKKVDTKEAALEKCLITYTEAQYTSLKRLVESIASRTSVTLDGEHVRAHCNTAANHGDPRNFQWNKIGISDPMPHKACSFSPEYMTKFNTWFSRIWG